jgi:hypothetical protein
VVSASDAILSQVTKAPMPKTMVSWMTQAGFEAGPARGCRGARGLCLPLASHAALCTRHGHQERKAVVSGVDSRPVVR